MRLNLKLIVISFFLLFSFPVLATTALDYVSVFKMEKPVQKGISELQKNIKKDIFRLNSTLNSQEKKISLNNEREKNSLLVPSEI